MLMFLKNYMWLSAFGKIFIIDITILNQDNVIQNRKLKSWHS